MGLLVPFIITVIAVIIASSYNYVRKWIKFHIHATKLPGPPMMSIFGNVKQIAGQKTEHLFDILNDLAYKEREKGSSVMRLSLMGKMYVWPLSGEAVASIIDSTYEVNKGDDYDFFYDWFGGGLLLEGYGERWRSHRKMLTPAFHFAKLVGYFEVFNAQAKILIECLDKYADSDEVVDLFPYIKRCALDVICGTAMGITVDAQHNHHNNKYMKAVEGFNKESVVYSFSPLLWNSFYFWLSGHKAMKDEYVKELKHFTNKVIDERKEAFESGEIEKETKKRNMNFLDLLLSMEDSKNMSREDIRQEVDTFMFAGHDTTTAATSWSVWNLAHHPEIQDKCYEELVQVFGDNPNTDLTVEGINNLNYVERCLKESKRVIAPVPAVQRRLRQDFYIDGHKIPSEANITIAPMALHRNHLKYKNPEKFNPDNFLPEEISKRHAYDYIPFSAGIRNCVGQKFSQLNEKVMMSHLLRNFKIVPMLAYNETKPCVEVVSKPSRGIPVKLIRR